MKSYEHRYDERLTALKRISREFGCPVSFNGFSLVDPSRITMVVFEPKDATGDTRRYDFSVLPSAFIGQVNNVGFDDGGITINGLRLPPVSSDDNRYGAKIPNIPYNIEGGGYATITLTGARLKGLIQTNRDENRLFRCYADKEYAEIRSLRLKDGKSTLRLAYRDTDEHVHGDAEKVQSAYTMEVLKGLTPIIPAGVVAVTFGDDLPLTISWEDIEHNRFKLLVAPRVSDYE